MLKTLHVLRPWQEEIIEIINSEPDDRTIYWFWEPAGGVGKSAFTRYVCIKREKEALVVGGKSADIKHGVAAFREKHGVYPRIIFIDIPRSYNKEFLNFEAMENIKNGCFFSPKYESNMVLGNPPHMIVFSNEEPDISKLSYDRWKIKLIAQ